MSPTLMFGFNGPNLCFLMFTKNACGPWFLPLTINSAITTARVATNPCEIHIFLALSDGVCNVNRFSRCDHVHVVCTINPLFTPANFSVNAKHPSSPRSLIACKLILCRSFPSSKTVPPNKLYSTVNRMLKPGPCSNPLRTSNRWARKNRSGFLVKSVNSSKPLLTKIESFSAECR